ncbi:YfiR family protein [Aliikangiella coralliicola]|nr:YfiR family protein [Aliikangiella coralliicola]
MFCVQSTAAEQKAAAMKVAYLYYFSKFIIWPKDSFANTEHVNLCIGDVNKEVQYQLSTINNKKVKEYKLRVIHIGGIKENFNQEAIKEESSATQESLDLLNRCHIIFVSESMSQWFNENSERFPEYSLVVAEDEQVVNSVILLHMRGRKLSFEIDNELAVSKQLKISAKLLKLSRKRSEL